MSSWAAKKLHLRGGRMLRETQRLRTATAKTQCFARRLGPGRGRALRTKRPFP